MRIDRKKDGKHFAPPPYLRNGHVQTMLNSMKLRRLFIHRQAGQMLGAATPCILDCGGGVRLMGLYSPHARKGKNPHARDLCILIHGWEGAADSSYLLSAAAYLWNRGFDVFRLNLRDHGPTHHLNPGLFHACRLDEVIGAVKYIQENFAFRRLLLGGFSLGGNFALRVGASAHRAGLRLERIAAVCPVLNPDRTLTALETGFPLYHWYFLKKWHRSLRIKQQLYPDLVRLEGISRAWRIRELTEYFVCHYTEFPDANAYLSGYAIVGGRLAELQVPAILIASRDDPVIPCEDLNNLAASSCLTIETQPYGGHCGFLKDYRLASWADQRLGEWFHMA